MQTLVTSKQIKTLEAEWIEKTNSKSSLTLMEKAAKALAEIAAEYKEPYLVVCGKGNNGGDGITAARYLHELGKEVFLYLTSDENSLSKDAKVNFEKIQDKIRYSRVTSENDKDFIKALDSSNTVIDCLLGTGTNNQLSSLFEWIINSINTSNKLVIACDIPTGVNPDTGSVTTIATKANITVTFGYPKIGLLVYPGKKYTGGIKTIDIGLPKIQTNYFLLDDSFVRSNLPIRDEEESKNKYGRTLLVCGSQRYPGAALLASKAAASIGSGLTALASPQEVLNKITPVLPEVIHVEFVLVKILEECLKSSALVIGPGLTNTDEIKTLVENLITKANVPIVLDADGINVIAKDKDVIKKAKKDIILTPHSKELARFLGISIDEVKENKLELAKSVAADLKCTVILKGPGTIIATHEGKIYISPFANSALAKGGTGDVLSGFIGGLIAQGLEPAVAACVGVYLHGKTGEIVKHEKTVYSLLPQDLINYLPQAIKLYINLN